MIIVITTVGLCADNACGSLSPLTTWLLIGGISWTLLAGLAWAFVAGGTRKETPNDTH